MQDVCDAVVVRIHPQFVNHHAGATRIFPGEESGAIGCAHRAAGDSVAEIRTFCGEFVYIRRARFGIAGIAARLIPQLISEDIDEVRLGV